MADVDDPPVQKIAIPGPTLAMIMQRFASSSADCAGLLFGHLRSVSSPNLADDGDDAPLRQELVATVTASTCANSPSLLLSSYDSLGRLDAGKFAKLLADPSGTNGSHRDPLLGWFVARRNTPLRPSMRESAVTASLRKAAYDGGSASENHADGGFSRNVLPRVSKSGLGLPYSESSSSDSQATRSPRREKAGTGAGDFQASRSPRREKAGGGAGDSKEKSPSPSARVYGIPTSFPCIFMIFSESLGQQHSIHTHEYKAFQYFLRAQGGVFEPKSVDIVNIGPGFRSLYSAFSPVSGFPMLPSGFEASQEESDDNREERGLQKSIQGSGRSGGREQQQGVLDMYSLGYNVDRFGQLIKSDAIHVVSEVEDLYHGMIAKLEHLAKQVAESSQALADQEKHNSRLRAKRDGME